MTAVAEPLLSRDRLSQARRVVLKIGSALLVDQRTGHVHRQWMESLAEDIVALRQRGVEVVVVSSGAVAVGRRHLGLPDGVLKLEEKQAAAATGQIRLAHAYQEVMAHHSVIVSQVLLTLGDSEDRRRYHAPAAALAILAELAFLRIDGLLVGGNPKIERRSQSHPP